MSESVATEGLGVGGLPRENVALVFGGGGGIGAAVCSALARDGARVVVADIDKKSADRVASGLDGASHLAVEADVSNREAVDAAVDQAQGRVGRPSILVNCAGFPRDNRLVDMTDEQWDDVVRVSLFGAFVTARAVVPLMKEDGYGRIINISSRAHWGNPGQANYSAAKAGLIGLTRSLAKELGRFGITANALAPGLIDTPAVRNLETFDLVEQMFIDGASIKRIGRPEDVAAAVRFLASASASFITGEVIHVSGGRYS